MASNVTRRARKHPPTKSETFAIIARDTGLTRQQVAAVFDSLYGMARVYLVEDESCGRFAIPGFAKVHVVERTETRARRGVSPVTGDPIVIPGKPRRRVIKLQPLKPLRDLLV